VRTAYIFVAVVENLRYWIALTRSEMSIKRLLDYDLQLC
jgi:hypothetical protein